ncbi:hypothetical protein OCU_47300 [Mycobacterium intracellulare ATCC 13950]|uniref:Uncharacterized protein n=1 Tax=Mycobacterium intracellulare (strain ATCC 13950 / DSM 43223 / JCM 6384 / NCTC 13025 / 3600) TaxID=487521 RepID=H8IW65_MYCIA|nr:hypothetical protein OCU_47300 [Mycobacterium intracellulare ATCC 13950]
MDVGQIWIWHNVHILNGIGDPISERGAFRDSLGLTVFEFGSA